MNPIPDSARKAASIYIHGAYYKCRCTDCEIAAKQFADYAAEAVKAERERCADILRKWSSEHNSLALAADELARERA